MSSILAVALAHCPVVFVAVGYYRVLGECVLGYIYPCSASDWRHWQGSAGENGLESRHGTWQKP